jgi:hypothetical protein
VPSEPEAAQDQPAPAPGPAAASAKPPKLSVRRTRAAIAAVAFLVTMVITRTITTFLHYKASDSSGGIVIRGVHVHHLVLGVVLLLLTGYAWLLLFGGGRDSGRWSSRVTSAAYGVSAALILDEFALLLNLRDVYWERQGRESITAVSAFAALLTLSVVVSPMVRVVLRPLHDGRRGRRAAETGTEPRRPGR